jgi:hypothetical protein
MLNDVAIPPPIELNIEYLDSANPLENEKYFIALMAWLRKISVSFDKYNIRPAEEIEVEMDE